jgi:hypothetical protein
MVRGWGNRLMQAEEVVAALGYATVWSYFCLDLRRESVFNSVARMYVARDNQTGPKRGPTNSTRLMNEHASSAAAGESRSRRIVSFDKAGKPRMSPMAPREAPRSKPRPHAEVHPCPMLASNRSMAVNRLSYCYACVAFGEVRQFEAHAVGKVVLCGSCGDKARDATFGRREPLDFAFLGGHFEGNRRRY